MNNMYRFFKCIIGRTSPLLLLMGIIATTLATSLVARAQDITITVTASTENVLAGDPFSYKVRYQCNSTTNNCLKVQFKAVLPVEYDGSSSNVLVFGDPLSASAVYDEASRTITWTMVDPLPAGSTGELEFRVRYPNGKTPDGTSKAPVVSGTSSNATFNTPTVAAVTAKASGAIKVEKILFGPSVVIDNNFTFELAITNNSPSPGGLNFTGMTVTDLLPNGVQFVSVEDGYVVTQSGQTLTIVANDPAFYQLAVGSNTRYIKITCKIPSGAGFKVGDQFVNTVNATANLVGGGTVQGTANKDFVIGDLSCTFSVDPGDRKEVSTQKLEANGKAPTRDFYLQQLNYNNKGNTISWFDIIVNVPPQQTANELYMYYGGPAKSDTRTIFYKTNLNTNWQTFADPNPSNKNLEGFPSLASGEYITSVRYQASGMLPGSAFYIGYRYYVPEIDNAGNTVTVGQTISVTYSYLNGCDPTAGPGGIPGPTGPGGTGNPPAYETGSLSLAVVKPKNVVITTKFVDPDFAKPGDEVEYTLYLDANESKSTAAITDAVVADLLPAGIDYVAGSAIAFDKSANDAEQPLEPTVIPNYQGTGRTLLRWTNWPYKISFTCCGQAIATFKVMVKAGVTAGTITNRWYLYSPTVEIISDGSEPVLPETDASLANGTPVDFTGNGANTESVLQSGPAKLTVGELTALQSYKWVKGSLDMAETRFPNQGKTTSGGTANYRLVVRNLGNVPVTKVKLYDILPFIGDKAVIGTQPRLTEWRPNLTSAVSFSASNPSSDLSQIKVLYSQSQNPCRDDVFVSSGCTNDWTLTPPSDLATVQALQFDFGSVVMNGADSIQLVWQMRAPVDAPAAGEIAWNSFAYVVSRADGVGGPLNPTEPLKVGISVNPPPPSGSVGDYVWKDTNKNGTQDTGEVGVNGVKVELFTAAGGPVTDITGQLVGPTFTSNNSGGQPGFYAFVLLPAGDYYVKFAQIPPACVIGSGADPKTGQTPNFSLATGQNRTDIDARLVPPAPLCNVVTKATATDPTCTTPGKIELISSNGDKYGISNGATYTGQAYAAATAIPSTLPAIIKNNISNAADSVYTIRIFSKANDCFKDTTVTVKALVKDATVSVANGFPACRSNGTAYTIKFTQSPAGSVVTAKDVATGAAIAVTGDSVANIALTVAKVRLIVTNGVCKDSVDVDAPVCDKPVGSIGDFVWKDVNDDGLQTLPSEKGVLGVKLNLYAAAAGIKTGAVLQSKTTDGNGAYLFSGLLAGSYIVEIDKTTLPDTCAITPKKDVNANGNDATDSDFDPTSGLSQVVVLNPVSNPTTAAEILATNNLTVDAGLVKVCINPNAGKDTTLACIAVGGTGSTASSLQLTATPTGGTWTAKAGNPTGATVNSTGLVSVDYATAKGKSFDFIYTKGGCIDTVKVIVPDCTIPCLKPSIGGPVPASQALCEGAAAGQYTFADPDAGANNYQWYNYTNSNTTVGTAIAGATGVFTPTTAQLPPADGNTYYYAMIATSKTGPASCSDTIWAAMTVSKCPKGSIGDYIWKDTNNNGINDEPTSAGVKGVKVQLLNNKGEIVVNTVLSGSQQVPPVATTATGTVFGSFNPTNDSLKIKISYSGLSSAPTMAHLHIGAIGANGGVTVGFTGFPTTTSGVYDAALKLTAAQKTNLLANLLYVNIHTSTNVGGEIRSQLVLCDTTDVTGKYSFDELPSGQYQVKILTNSLPISCVISSMTNKGTDDTKDSDFNPTTGLSQLITIDVSKPTTDTLRNNPTVDAALFSPKGSLGDFVWKDTNNNGLQDETTPNGGGVKGVIVELYKNGGTTPFASDTTDATGKYLFSNLDAGTYYIKLVTTSIPAGCIISTMKDAGTDDTKDSDVDATGKSGNYVIDPADSAKKDILTADAALYTPCVKPNAGPNQTLACGLSGTTTADLLDAATGQKWKVLSVQPNTTVKVTTPEGLVSGMTLPGTYSFVLQTQSDSLACRDTVNVTVPECACPQVSTLTPNATVCKDSLFPTLNITIVGNNTQGIGAVWYANLTGGTALATGLSYKPAGVASVTDTFYVQLTGVTGACAEAARTAVIVAVQNCSKIIDLALKKGINTKIAKIGDELIYTIKVFSQPLAGSVNATGVEVTDSIATTVQFVTGSFVASRGNAVISGNVIKWTIGGIAAAGVPANAGANGDTVMLTYKVKATMQGVHFNTAEISKTNEKDVDSMPGNGKDGEDDIDRQCFTVPFTLCSGEKVSISVPAQYTNVIWSKTVNGQTTTAGSGNELLVSEVGSYTFTATNKTCPASGCCPVIIEPGTNCCPANICVPFTITKKKKK